MAAPAEDVNEAGKNVAKIKCKFCSEIIFAPASALAVSHPLQLPRSDEADATEPTLHWFVKSQFDFWNIGVARPHNEADESRYLLCANCDKGPLGVWLKTGDEAGFYVPRDRVAIDG